MTEEEPHCKQLSANSWEHSRPLHHDHHQQKSQQYSGNGININTESHGSVSNKVVNDGLCQDEDRWKHLSFLEHSCGLFYCHNLASQAWCCCFGQNGWILMTQSAKKVEILLYRCKRFSVSRSRDL